MIGIESRKTSPPPPTSHNPKKRKKKKKKIKKKKEKEKKKRRKRKPYTSLPPFLPYPSYRSQTITTSGIRRTTNRTSLKFRLTFCANEMTIAAAKNRTSPWHLSANRTLQLFA
jgi:hypothetical protein